MPGFIVKNTLTVQTQGGDCQIQICLGDVTKLPREDKVDVLLISAFQGDYSATLTSCIGALLRNLNISVRNLAKDKQEDLRKLYHCWWSKSLPVDMPYNRILCFETKLFGSQRPEELVSDVFRCLVPVLNNQDGTVVTPLLNTGDQGYDKGVMLKGMVEAAVNWMKAGLLLRLLKIVLYYRADMSDEEMIEKGTKAYSGVLKTFEELKEIYETKDTIPQVLAIEFDVYMSFSKNDVDDVDVIIDKLRSNKPDIRIFNDKQVINAGEVWQQDMYNVLTPNYLQCTACVEQYNIALCCTRKVSRDMLAPLYLQETDLPTYMTQVQYVDCRSKEIDQISEACLQIIVTLSVTVQPVPTTALSSIHYDVFISYSHTDSERANHIVQLLRRLNPDLQIFFDLQELKTGNAWQQTLYHSIEGTKVMIALISDKYLDSPVCAEEYNLALAKHCSLQDRLQLKLVPICIEDVSSVVKPEFTKVKMVNAIAERFAPATEATCTAVADWLAGRRVATNMKQIFEKDKELAFEAHQIIASSHQVHFKKKHGSRLKLLREQQRRTFPSELPKSLPVRPDKGDHKETDDCDVAFSYAAEDEKYALFLAGVIGQVGGVRVKTKPPCHIERISLIDRAKHIIALLSPHYTASQEQCEEFNLALSRQRTTTGRILFPVLVHVLPMQPTYFHLVPAGIDTMGKMWSELCTSLKMDSPVYFMDNSYHIAKPVELALREAATEVLEAVQVHRTSGFDSKRCPTLINILKLKSQLDTMFDDRASSETVGEYLLSVTTDEDKDDSGSKSSLCGDEQTTTTTATTTHAREPDGTGSNQPGSHDLDTTGSGSIPPVHQEETLDCVDLDSRKQSQEELDSTGSNEPVPVSLTKPAVPTVGSPSQIQQHDNKNQDERPVYRSSICDLL